MDDFYDMDDPDELQNMAESGSVEYSHRNSELEDGMHIEGDLDEYMDDTENAAADAFFASMEESRDIKHGDNHKRGVAYGGASAAALKQHQFAFLPVQAKKIVLDAAKGITPTGRNVDAVEMQVAINKMGSDIEGSPAAALSGVKLRKEEMPSKYNTVSPSLYGSYEVSGLVEETKYGKTKLVRDNTNLYAESATTDVTYSKSGIGSPSQSDLNLAHGYMTRTDIYMGNVGSRLAPGVVPNSTDLSGYSQDVQAKEQNRLDTEFAQAMAFSRELAGAALSEANQNSKIGEETLDRAQAEFLKYSLNGSAVEGSSRLLMLPNEYGIPFGTKDTANIGGTWSGSPHTRESFAKLEMTADDPRYWEMRPSVKNSLYGGKGIDKPTRDYEYEQALYKAHFVSRVLKEQMPEHRNESEGQGRYTRGYDPTDETYRLSQQNWGEAALLGLDGQPTAGAYDYGDFARNTGEARHALGRANADITVSGGQSIGNMSQQMWNYITTGEQDGGFTNTELPTAQGLGSARSVPLDGAQDALSEQQLYSEAIREGATQEEAFKVARSGYSMDDVRGMRSDPLRGDFTAREKYNWMTRQYAPPEQGSAEWLNLRKGKLTASVAATLMGKHGTDIAARNMLEDRLDPTGAKGYRSSGNKPFMGNTFSARGSAGEEAAKRKFLMQNPGIIAEDAYFETRDDLPGMGASPDARLYNEDGSSAGLLELKILKGTRIPGAMDRYTAQMQLQMLVTGESQTTLFVTNADTGETTQDIMYADEEYQQELINRAQAVFEKLDATPETVEGVKALRAFKNKEGGLAARQKAAAGAAARFVPSNPTAVEAPMTAWRDGGSGPRTNEEQFAAAEINYRNKPEQRAGDMMTELYRIKQEDAGMQKADGRGPATMNQGSEDGPGFSTEELEAAHAEALQMANDRIQAEGEASDSVREFSDSLKQAQDSAKSWAGAVDDAFKMIREGMASGMGTIRLAAEIGQGADETRGSQWAMRQGGIDERDANSLLMAAGNMQAKFNNEETAASEFTRIKAELGKSPGIADKFDTVRWEKMKGMSPSQLLNFADKESRDLSPEMRSQYMRVMGYDKLAAYDGRGGSMTQSVTVEAEAMRQANLGQEDGRIGHQILQEATVSTLKGDETSYNKGLGVATNEILNSYKSTSNAIVKLGTAALAAGAILGGKAGDAGLLEGARMGAVEMIEAANSPDNYDSQGNVILPSRRVEATQSASQGNGKPQVNINLTNIVDKNGDSELEAKTDDADINIAGGHFSPLRNSN